MGTPPGTQAVHLAAALVVLGMAMAEVRLRPALSAQTSTKASVEPSVPKAAEDTEIPTRPPVYTVLTFGRNQAVASPSLPPASGMLPVAQAKPVVVAVDILDTPPAHVADAAPVVTRLVMPVGPRTKVEFKAVEKMKKAVM